MSIHSRKRRAQLQQIDDAEVEETQRIQEQEKDHQLISFDSILDFPTHIIIEIFLKLPIKNLFNCRRVCKSWRSVISDHRFAKLHLSRSQISLLLRPVFPVRQSLYLIDLLFAPSVRPQEAMTKLTFEILPKHPEITWNFLNSCNGLLCLCKPLTDDPIYVCNPFLGEYITLPTCLDGTKCADKGSAFGFCPVTNQYKVLRSLERMALIGYDHLTDLETHKRFYELEICTLGEGLWRSLGKYNYTVQNYNFNAFLNGALHWLDSYHRCSNLIHCFDFVNEEFRVVPAPSELDRTEIQYPFRMCEGVIRGCLMICDCSNFNYASIWVMKDYGVQESWVKDLVIENMIFGVRQFNTYQPIMVLGNGKILILFHDALLLYDPELKCSEQVGIYRITSHFEGIAHVPSLVSLKDVVKGENLEGLQRRAWDGSNCKWIWSALACVQRMDREMK